MDPQAAQEQQAAKARPILRRLHADMPDVEASAVVTFDGITMASLLSQQADKDRFGAMCASLLALASRATKEVDRGTLRQIILDGDLGPLLLTHAGRLGVLAVAAGPKAHLGRLLMETRKIAGELALLADPPAA